jgi:hypothetical protein
MNPSVKRSFQNRVVFVRSMCFFTLVSCLLTTSCNVPKPETAANHQRTSAAALPDMVPLGNSEVESKSFTKSADPSTGTFVDLPSSVTGVEFTNQWPTQFDPGMQNSFISAGIGVADFNNDGLVDFFAARKSDGGRLYQNVGDFKFRDVTEEWGLKLGNMWSSGVTFADVNNDGHVDLFLCGNQCPNRLFINYGDRFVDKTKEFGLEFSGASVVMTFADYDRDGDLDAFLLTNRVPQERPPFRAKKSANGVPQIPPGLRENTYLMKHPNGKYIKLPAGQFDHLYRNDGSKFVEVSNVAGIGQQPYFGLSATWWDYNNDGWPDLYVANDFMGPDHFFKNNGPNEDGVVTFSDVTKTSVPHTPWFSMGADMADINNDGLFDLLASDMAGSNHYRDKLSMGAMSGPDSRAWFLNWPTPPQYMRNSLYLNSGTDRFMEAANLAGLATTDWTWTVRFSDFDQDGWEDVYFTNGMSRDWFNGDVLAESHRILNVKGKEAANNYWFKQPKFDLENLVFKNKGDLKFENVSSKWGLDHKGVSTGGATGDFDGDGDLDLIVNGYDEPLKIYRNDVSTGNAIKLKLVGRKSNRSAIGTRVELQTMVADNTMTQVRFNNSNQGFMSCSEPVVHFGIGDGETVDQVSITWASGVVQQLTDLAANQTYTITEPETGSAETKKPTTPPMFRVADSVLPDDLNSREFAFDDFELQPLIPNKYSQLGPGMAWSDVDGDGDEDCFVGGSKSMEGNLLINEGGKLKRRQQECFRLDRDAEDMGVLFFDADGDGDEDLYVVNGSVEARVAKDNYQHRLYLNDGTGNFESATTERLPEIQISGSCVTAADFDRDGDLDLFVGGRIMPGEYPLPPASMILINEHGKFSDQTTSLAPALREVGMVTSAIWTDVNSDSWIDLVVTCEWGTVNFFINDEGQFRDATEESGLAKISGWFNSISGGDIDGDGDTDYVVGNVGLNTKYKATPDKPELMFFGNFDDSEKRNIIEAKYENGVCLPRRGLGCTSSAIPIVKKNLPTYHEFALSSLTEIYQESALDEALRFEANQLESLVLINQSTTDKVSFSVEPLPRVAQISPIFGTTLIDIDGDRFLDLIVAQNFFGPQRETGNMDGGVSMLLKGTGDGKFQPVWPNQSGIAIPDDAKSLTVVDLNQDHRPDLLFGINNGTHEYLENSSSEPTPRSLRLVGPTGNRKAIGSRIRLVYEDGSSPLLEVYAGSGYLSQSSTELFLSLSDQLKEIEVSWPDGSNQSVSAPFDFENDTLTIEKN